MAEAGMTLESFKAMLNDEQRAKLTNEGVRSLEALLVMDDEVLEVKCGLKAGEIGELKAEDKRRKTIEKRRQAATTRQRPREEREEESEDEEMERKQGERAGRLEGGYQSGFLADRYHLRALHPTGWGELTSLGMRTLVGSWWREPQNMYLESEVQMVMTCIGTIIDDLEEEESAGSRKDAALAKKEASTTMKVGYILYVRLLVILLRAVYSNAADIAQQTLETAMMKAKRDIRQPVSAMLIFNEAEQRMREEAEKRWQPFRGRARGRGNFQGFRGRGRGTSGAGAGAGTKTEE